MKIKKIFSQQNILLWILFMGFAVRIVGIGSIPGGLNQDEASIGYEAYSLLKYGIDRNGIANPVHLLSWGSGQNIAYAWFCMPFIAVLGLSVFTIRLPMALAGGASIYAFYLMVKEIYDENTALWTAFFFAIFPWHIMKSRWALESNIFPDLVLWGVLLLVLYIKREKIVYLYMAVAVFAFSVYSYGTAYMFMPMFIAGVWIYMLIKGKISIKHFLLSAALCAVLVLPIMLFVIINITDYEQIKMLGFAIPKMYQQRFSTVAISDGNSLVSVVENMKVLWRILINQGDGLPWNSMDKYGICYAVLIPHMFTGAVSGIVRRRSGSFIMYWWVICAAVTAAVTDINVNRVNILFIPLAFFIALSLAEFAKANKGVKYCLVCTCILLFSLFCRSYFTQWSQNIRPYFFASYDKALEYATSETDGDIYITANINQPYILTLFYTQDSPEIYLDTVEKSFSHVAFEQIKSYDRFHFYMPDNAADNAAYITDAARAEDFDRSIYEITDFEYYSVIMKK